MDHIVISTHWKKPLWVWAFNRCHLSNKVVCIYFGHSQKMVLGWMNGKIIWPKSRKTAPALEIPYFQRVSISVVQDKKPLKSYDFSGFLHFSSRFLVVYFPSLALNHVGTISGALPLPPVSRLVPSSAPPFPMRPPAGFLRMMRCSWTNLRQRREFGGCSAPSWHWDPRVVPWPTVDPPALWSAASCRIAVTLEKWAFPAGHLLFWISSVYNKIQRKS